MNRNLTELVFLLDRSESMAGLEQNTIRGYNRMLQNYKRMPGEAIITTVLFNHKIEVLHTRESIQKVPALTKKEYCVQGKTALLDSIGKLICYMGNVQKYAKEEERAGKVLFVIATGWHDNASSEYNYERIRKLMTCLKERYHWEFIALLEGIDPLTEVSAFLDQKNG
jgi:hypothetical protein